MPADTPAVPSPTPHSGGGHSPEQGDQPRPKAARKRRLPVAVRILLALLTLGLVFHWLENHRGRNAWETERQQLAQEQVPLTLAEALAAAAAQRDLRGTNFCRLPLVAALRRFDTGPGGEVLFHDPDLVSQFDSLQLPLRTTEPPHFGAIGLQTPADLTAWTTWLDNGDPGADDASAADLASPSGNGDETRAAERILEHLSPSDWVYATLVEAARESGHAVFPPYLDGDESLEQLVDLALPEVARLLHVGDAVQLRGLAALALAEPDTDAALDALTVLLRLGEALRSGPALIHSVNANHLDEACLNLVWDGLRRDAWSPEQIETLRRDLRRIQPREQLRHTLEVELSATVLLGCDYFRTRRGQLGALMRGRPGFAPDRPANPLSTLFWQLLMPRGWLDQNKATTARLLVDHAIHPLARQELPPPFDSSTLARTPYRFFADLAIAGHLYAVNYAIDGAAWLALADTALAIRQFEQRHGRSPDSLQALVDDRLVERLPVDSWSPDGDPLIYVTPSGGAVTGADSDAHPVWRLHSIGPDPDHHPAGAHRPEWIGESVGW